ncbi:hypothetical protein ACSSS7_002739 [Eimeria intestinalis]
MASPAALAACKAVAALLFLLVALTGAAVPFALKRCNVSNRISYLNAFAGGAFLALGILHIMPEAIDLLNELGMYIHLNGKPFAITHLLIFLGYILILFCEEVLSGGTSHSHLDVEAFYPAAAAMLRCYPAAAAAAASYAVAAAAAVPAAAAAIYALAAAATAVPAFAKMSAAALAIDCGATTQELAVVSPVPLGEEHKAGSSSSAGASSSSSSSSSNKPCMQRRTFDSGAFFMMLALAIHGLFEGAIVGAAGELSMMWMISAVVLGHKWAESMLLMCQMMERKLRLVFPVEASSVVAQKATSDTEFVGRVTRSAQTTALLMGAFVMSSPFGVLIGAILAAEGKLASGICNALGAGTVLYIAGEVGIRHLVGGLRQRTAAVQRQPQQCSKQQQQQQQQQQQRGQRNTLGKPFECLFEGCFPSGGPLQQQQQQQRAWQFVAAVQKQHQQQEQEQQERQQEHHEQEKQERKQRQQARE